MRGLSEIPNSLGATDAVIAPSNANRVELVIPSPGAGSLFIRFGSIATTAIGFQLGPNEPPLHLKLSELGRTIQDSVHGIMSVPGPTNITVWDISELP